MAEMTENGQVPKSQMALKGPKWPQNGLKLAKTGSKRVKITQNRSQTCFYDFLEKIIFSDFLTQNGRKWLSPLGPNGLKMPKMPQNELKLAKTGSKQIKTTQNRSQTCFYDFL